MARASIFLVTVVLIAGMVGCVRLPSRNLDIRDWYDLEAVRRNLQGNHRLMNDLDATTAGYQELASPTANGGRGWQPIGGYLNPPALGIKIFEGTFDGQGYQIRDLFINRPDEYSVGLFGAVHGSKQVGSGVVANVGVVNATVTGGSYVGALVAYITELLAVPGTVSNCYATGSVAGNLSVGGLVGVNIGTVNSCNSVASVTGHDQVGGLVGVSFGTVSDSYCSGNVTGYADVGGLVGRNADAVSSCCSSAWVTGEQSVGGLVGRNEYSGAGVDYCGTVTNSFWDTETSGQATSDGGTGKNTTEMQDFTTFSVVGWNITAVANPATRDPSYLWNIVDGVTYPFLSWEP